MTRVSRPDLNAAAWRKSSYSNQEGGDCVEIADNIPTTVPVRDSKTPADTTLLFPTPTWTDFLTHLTRHTLHP